ncbi:MAG: SpaH/EbpB family LPXTG-anchored major pilin [Lactobacillus delbrueckii]|nr:SpaH/EbpB family LPXTG-anchored major pilin [Lactobacillus delbrueckii]
MKRGKFAALLAVLGLGMQLLAAVSVQAAANYQEDKPSEVTVKLHKYKTTSDLTGKTFKNSDFGDLSTDSLKSALGLGDSDNLEPAANVQFEYFKVNEDDRVDSLSKLSVAELEKKYTENGKITTNSDGLATVTVQEENFGRYYFVELTKTDSSFETAPFLIDVPSYVSGKGYTKEMNVYPKNKVTTPTPGKDVERLGNNDCSVDVGSRVKWFLKGTIPADIAGYKTYEFEDRLDSALTYDESFTPVVRIGSKTLTAGTDYTVIVPKASEKTLKVALSKEGMKKASAAYQAAGQSPSAEEIEDVAKNSDDNPFVEVEFQTVVNHNAYMGQEIPNKTTLNFDNGGKLTGKPESDVPEVHTGGLRFVKKDALTGKKLAGAVFELYQADGVTPVTWTQEMIERNKKTNANSKFLDQEVGKIVKMVSNDDGAFEILGLKYGESGQKNDVAESNYVVKEVKAPEGYSLPDDPKTTVTVNSSSYYSSFMKKNNTDGLCYTYTPPVEILNNKTPSLPLTGGVGSALFVIAGLMLFAFAFYQLKRQKA